MTKFLQSILLGLSFILFVPVGAANAATLKVGASAPDFTTQGALAGKPFKLTLSQALKKGPVVLYFFPKVFTSGCTIEANMFADATADFTAAGATVIGMSGDDIPGLTKFSTAECRDKFAVAQATSAIIKGYGVRLAPGLNMTSRTSFVIAPGGKIALVYSDMNPREHVARTLAAVKSLPRKR